MKKKGCGKPGAAWLCSPGAHPVWPRLEGRSERFCGGRDLAYPASPHRPVRTEQFWFCDDCIEW